MPNDTRLLVVQPTLAKYRVPVWRELAGRDGIDLRVWYGDHAMLQSVAPEGFVGELKPIRSWKLAGQEVLWHAAQIEAVRGDEVDAVILSWGPRYFSLGPALRTARRRGLPVVLWGHGFSQSESWLRKYARDRLAKQADALLFYDARTAQAAIDSGWDADRVFVAPNAIDQVPIVAARDAWEKDADRLARFREANDLNGRRVLLYVSRLSRKAGLPLLIEAIDKLRRDKPEVLVVLIGGGEMQEELEASIAQRGLENHVRMLGPIYEEQQLAPWFVSAEAFVYPTAIGLSLLHALGYGLPVVTNDDMGAHFPEIVAYNPDPSSPDANGIVYRAGDTDSFAATLGELLDDPERLSRLSAAARRTVEQDFNVPAMVDGMVAAVQRAIRSAAERNRR